MNDATTTTLPPALMEAMLAADSDVVVVSDERGRITWASPAAERVLGWHPDEFALVGPHLVHPEDELEADLASEAARHRCGSHDLGIFRLAGADGDWHELEATAINLLADHGVMVHRYRDLGSRPGAIEAEDRMDDVTGLPGRASVHRSLEERLFHARHSVAVLFLDLDGFKQVNDGFGHAAGDRVLRDVADRLQLRLRDSELLVRWGGDEFVVLVDVPGPALAINVATRLHAAVNEKPFDLGDGGEAVLGVSIGVAFGTATDDPDALVQAADRAMYTAKRRGGGIVTADELVA